MTWSFNTEITIPDLLTEFSSHPSPLDWDHFPEKWLVFTDLVDITVHAVPLKTLNIRYVYEIDLY